MQIILQSETWLYSLNRCKNSNRSFYCEIFLALRVLFFFFLIFYFSFILWGIQGVYLVTHGVLNHEAKCIYARICWLNYTMKKYSHKILRICFTVCARTPLAKHWNLSEESCVSIPHRNRRRGDPGRSVRIQKKGCQTDNLR